MRHVGMTTARRFYDTGTADASLRDDSPYSSEWMGVDPFATGILALDSGNPNRNSTVANVNLPLFQP